MRSLLLLLLVPLAGCVELDEFGGHAAVIAAELELQTGTANATSNASAADVFVQTALPYAQSALASKGISAETLSYHYGKHHAGYVTALNAMPEAQGRTVLEIMTSGEGGKIFNMAAQVWNHEFYWNSMSASGGGEPTGTLKTAIESDFGSVDNFKKDCIHTVASTLSRCAMP